MAKKKFKSHIVPKTTRLSFETRNGKIINLAENGNIITSVRENYVQEKKNTKPLHSLQVGIETPSKKDAMNVDPTYTFHYNVKYFRNSFCLTQALRYTVSDFHYRYKQRKIKLPAEIAKNQDGVRYPIHLSYKEYFEPGNNKVALAILNSYKISDIFDHLLVTYTANDMCDIINSTSSSKFNFHRTDIDRLCLNKLPKHTPEKEIILGLMVLDYSELQFNCQEDTFLSYLIHSCKK